MSAELTDRRIAIANQVLDTFVPGVLLYQSNHAKRDLRMCWDVRKGKPKHDFTAQLRGDGSWTRYGYNQRPTGGTGMQALAQLIRYVRDLNRLPLSTWEYWATNKVGLTNEHTVELLKNSDYGDPKKTCCVLCGTTEFKKGLDWWSLDGVTGPSCFGGLCRKEQAA
jgi:hypothetical protein